MSAVSWPWVPACGSLEPPRRDGENAQKTGKNGEKMGKIQPKTCKGRGLTKDQLGEDESNKTMYTTELKLGEELSLFDPAEVTVL